MATMFIYVGHGDAHLAVKHYIKTRHLLLMSWTNIEEL